MLTSSVNKWLDDVITMMPTVNATQHDLARNLSSWDVMKVDSGPYTVAVNGYISPVVIAITIVANSLVCAVLLQRTMRSPTSLLLLAMAVSDSLTGSFPLPVYIYFYTFGNYQYLYVPYAWCHAYEVLTVVLPTICHTASVWFTVALSVQRYICVCHPLKAKWLCSTRKTVKVIVAVCLVAALTHSTPIIEWKFQPLELPLPLATIEHSSAPSDWSENYLTTADSVLDSTATDAGRLSQPSTNLPLPVSGTSSAVESATIARWYGCRSVETELTQAYVSFVYFSLYSWYRIVFVHLVPCTSLIVLNVILLKDMRAAQVCNTRVDV
jgi:hypothetical protein